MGTSMDISVLIHSKYSNIKFHNWGDKYLVNLRQYTDGVSSPTNMTEWGRPANTT